MKSNKFNVILMRDDTSVKNFRLSTFWIKLLLLIFVLLIIASGTGIYLSYVFYEEKSEMALLYERKAESLNEAERELKRLQNVEKMFESYNEDQLRSLLIVQRQEEHREEHQDSTTAVDLGDILEPLDKNIVSVSNVQARFVQGRMRVQLEVNNLAGNETVSGRIHIFLIRNDGTTIDLNLEDRELYYAIARFKKIDTTFSLPEEVDQESIFALRIKARDEEGSTVYSDVFLISSILV